MSELQADRSIGGTGNLSNQSTAAPLLVDRFENIVVTHQRKLIVIVLGLYLAGFNGQWRLEPDSALFLSLGRNLAEGRGYTYLGRPNHLAYPGLPWVNAALFKLFGDHALFAANTFMLLTALAALGLTYRLFRLHAGSATAMVVMLGVGITKTFYRYAFELRSDMPFLLGVMAFFCGFEAIFAKPTEDQKRSAKWFDWTLLIGGFALAAVMRPTMWTLLLAIIGSVVYQVARRRMPWQTLLLPIGAIVLGAAVMVSWGNGAGVGSGYEWYVINSLTHQFGGVLAILPEHLKELLTWATADAVFQVRLGPGNIIISTALIVLGVGLLRNRVLWGLFFIGTVLMILIILPLDRYYLPVIPLMVFAWWQALQKLNRAMPNRAGQWITFALLMLGMASNLDKVGGIIVEQRSMPFIEGYDGGAFEPLTRLADVINKNVEENAVVLISSPYGRIMAFLSRRNVVDSHHFDDIDIQAHPIYVVEPAETPIRELLLSYGLQDGRVIDTVSSESNGQWTLRRTIPLPPPIMLDQE